MKIALKELQEEKLIKSKIINKYENNLNTDFFKYLQNKII